MKTNWNICFSKELGPFLGESTWFHKEGVLLPKELGPYLLNLLAIIIISFLYLYMLVTYHWKGVEENYNDALPTP